MTEQHDGRQKQFQASLLVFQRRPFPSRLLHACRRYTSSKWLTTALHPPASFQHHDSDWKNPSITFHKISTFPPTVPAVWKSKRFTTLFPSNTSSIRFIPALHFHCSSCKKLTIAIHKISTFPPLFQLSRKVNGGRLNCSQIIHPSALFQLRTSTVLAVIS